MKRRLPLSPLLFAAAVFAQSSTDMSKTDTLTFTRDASVLDEQRNVGKRADDFQVTFPAVKIDPATMSEVKTTAGFRHENHALLFFSPDKSKAVLDERLFGDLTAVNVTTLAEGNTIVIGKLKEPGRKLAPRAVAWFLMSAGILQTFVHLESTVKLEDEKTAEGLYEVVFTGKHVYFTNSRHEPSFRFQFRIDKDGSMRVEGRK